MLLKNESNNNKQGEKKHLSKRNELKWNKMKWNETRPDKESEGYKELLADMAYEYFFSFRFLPLPLAWH